MPDDPYAVHVLSTTTSYDHELVQETLPSYSTAGTTALPESSEESMAAPQNPDPVAAWQMTRDAVRFRGRWVALDETTGRVLAVADSPTDFDEELTRDATLVFVRPSIRPAGR